MFKMGGATALLRCVRPNQIIPHLGNSQTNHTKGKQVLAVFGHTLICVRLNRQQMRSFTTALHNHHNGKYLVRYFSGLSANFTFKRLLKEFKVILECAYNVANDGHNHI